MCRVYCCLTLFMSIPVAANMSDCFEGNVVASDETPLVVSARSRDPQTGDVVVSEARLVPRQTAIIVCDMWNHHWCQGAEQRCAEMAVRMNAVLEQCRNAGVFIIHAPSGTMDFYKDAPQRKLAMSAPTAANLPSGIDQWLRHLPSEGDHWPIDQSDGGCDCTLQCKTGSPWTRQIETITIAANDAITDSGHEVWNLMEQRGIKNVVLMGVHTNMCVLVRIPRFADCC